MLRERDTNANGSLDERLYYLQNWRHDVVVIMNYDGAVKERVTYDAYGRPHAFSPGDIKRTSGSADRPDGTLDANDTWTTGSVVWNKDLGNASGVAIPNNTVDANDGTTLTNLKAAGYSAGYGVLSTSAVDNRKGYAGYEFDPVLQGSGSVHEKPVYHVRHRVLASDTGKWLQKDPMGYHDSMDLYEYCKSDPTGLADWMGLTASCSTSSCHNFQVRKATSAYANASAAAMSQAMSPWLWLFCSSSKCEQVCKLRPDVDAPPPGGTFCENGRPCICICSDNIKRRWNLPDNMVGPIAACVLEKELVGMGEIRCDKNPPCFTTSRQCAECASWRLTEECLLSLCRTYKEGTAERVFCDVILSEARTELLNWCALCARTNLPASDPNYTKPEGRCAH